MLAIGISVSILTVYVTQYLSLPKRNAQAQCIHICYQAQCIHICYQSLQVSPRGTQ